MARALAEARSFPSAAAAREVLARLGRAPDAQRRAIFVRLPDEECLFPCFGAAAWNES